MSTPSGFVTAAFDLLADASSIIIDQYFEDEPSGITYVKISLAEESVDVLVMNLMVTWSDSSTISHSAQGPRTWHQAVAEGLLGLSPLP